MSRALLSGFRIRLLNTNGSPETLPVRLAFFDSSTSLAKPVYSGPLISDSALGVTVQLDATGYGPAAGIWLDPGEYDIVVQRKETNTGVDATDWNHILWSLNHVPGGSLDSTVTDATIRFLDTVNDLRQAVPGGTALLGGYFGIGDGGQGTLRWDSTSMVDDDGGSVYKPTTYSSGAPGRWIRIFSGTELNVQNWGAVTGSPDVTGPVISAIKYASRTMTDTGKTLVFPEGLYNLGTSVVTLDGVGTTPSGKERKVQYHLQGNAVFISNADTGIFSNKATIDFQGHTRVDGMGAHTSGYAQLLFNDVVNEGEGVCPEWFGADPTDLTYSDWALSQCWAGCGNNPIRLTGRYTTLMTYVCTAGLQIFPPIVASPGAKLTLGGNNNVMEIGPITCGERHSSVLFAGELDALRIYNCSYLESGWFDISTITKFKQFGYASNSCSPVFLWTEAYTWGGCYNSSATGSDQGSNLYHTFSSSSFWNLGNNIVKVHLINPPPSKFLYVTSAQTGTFFADGYPELDARWFGATGPLINDALKALFRSAIANECSVVFPDQLSTVNDTIDLYIPDQMTIRIRGLRLKLTDATKTLFLLHDGTGMSTSVAFQDCELTTDATEHPAALVSSTLWETILDRCTLTFGTVSFKGRGYFTATNTKFEHTPCNIGTTGYLSRFQDCFHNECTVIYYGNNVTNTFANVYSKNNVFQRTSGTYDIGFVAVGTKVLASNVKIDNTYNTNIVTHVKDLTDGTNGTWLDTNAVAHPYYQSHHHDVEIAGQTTGQQDYGPYYTQNMWDTMVCPGAAFRLYGVLSSETRVQSATCSYSGQLSGHLNSAKNDPVWCWFGDWITADTPESPANGRFNLGYQFTSNPVDYDHHNDLTLYVRVNWKILL